jgi:hypothetical protein
MRDKDAAEAIRWLNGRLAADDVLEGIRASVRRTSPKNSTKPEAVVERPKARRSMRRRARKGTALSRPLRFQA